MPQVPYELTQGLNVVNPGIREGVDVKTYPNLQAEQMVESGTQMVRSGTNLKIMMDQVMLDRAEAEAKSHDSEIADTLRVKLYDSNNGFTTLSGKAALDRRDQITKEINDYKKDYISKIKDPFVAQLVSRAAGTRYQHAYQTIDSHTSSQGKVYEASASAARIDTLNNDIAALHANNGDNVQIATLKATRDSEIESLAKKQGLVNKDGEVDRSNPLFVAMMSSVETKLVRDMVTNSVTQDNPAKARAVLEANKKGIDQTVYNQLSNLVSTGSVKNESMKLFDSMSSLPSSRQKAAAKDMFTKGEISAEVRDAWESRIDKRESDLRQSSAVRKNSIMDQIQAYAANNPNAVLADFPATLQQNAKDAGVWSDAQRFMFHGKNVTDPTKWAEISGWSQAQWIGITPERFVAENRQFLDTPTLERGLSMLRAAQGNKDPKTVTTVVQNKMLRSKLIENNIIPNTGKPSEEEAQRQVDIEIEVDNRTREFNNNSGRRPSNPEYEKIISGVLSDTVKVSRLFGDKKISVFGMLPEEMQKAYVSVEIEPLPNSRGQAKRSVDVYLKNITTSETELYTKKLINMNQPVTQAAIAELWLVDQQGKSK
jgi:hypothetical protein